MKDLLCNVCKKYPENNCSRCNIIKESKQQGISQRTQDILDIIEKERCPYLCKHTKCLILKELKSQIKALDKLQEQESEKRENE